MYKPISRISWDTTVKHYVRQGLFDNLPEDLKVKVPSSNKSRWKNEPDDKYLGCDVAEYINKELELIKRIGRSRKIKNINEAYFKLNDLFHNILQDFKGIKQKIGNHKDLIVNTIENLKADIPIENALRVFDISRATYQNYKLLVMNKCEASYFLWCTKRYPNQLLKKEVNKIKAYMNHKEYQFWSKSSVYLKAVRDGAISCGLSTWYKYCKLLGYIKIRHLQPKKKYESLKTEKPNQIWCADITIFKTTDGTKHYIHIIMDHFSKKILGYGLHKSSSAIAVKKLLENAIQKYRPDSDLQFLTDGGSENINSTVSEFLNLPTIAVKHLIAQKDIVFSNSAIEAFNKVIKHQFLLPKGVSNRKHLDAALKEDILIYNNIRPQKVLAGNTPNETFNNIPMDFSRFSQHFKAQKVIRLAENRKNHCKICHKV